MKHKTVAVNVKMNCSKKSVKIKITKGNEDLVHVKYKMDSDNISSADISRLMTFLEILNK